MELITIKQIGNNIFQIIGKSNQSNEFVKTCLVREIAKLAEKAEECRGIPQQEFEAHDLPDNIVVHATYMFQTGTDIQKFLNEFENI